MNITLTPTISRIFATKSFSPVYNPVKFKGGLDHDVFERTTKEEKPTIDEFYQSKTMKKLYSPEMNIFQGKNEDGYYTTTIIDKKTGRPVPAYVKEFEHKHIDNNEMWEIFEQKQIDDKKIYSPIGIAKIYKDFDKNRVYMTYMESFENEKYEGVGLRLHQLAIERMSQEGLEEVKLNCEPDAFPFHYKSGFRYSENNKELEQKNKINYYERGFVPYDYIEMSLNGENLQQWKDRAEKYPIIQ